MWQQNCHKDYFDVQASSELKKKDNLRIRNIFCDEAAREHDLYIHKMLSHLDIEHGLMSLSCNPTSELYFLPVKVVFIETVKNTETKRIKKIRAFLF